MQDSRKSKTLNDASIEECRIFAYYLYVICSYKLDCYPDADDNDEYLYGLFGFFERLANRMNRSNIILNYLSKIVIQYQNHKVLKEIEYPSQVDSFVFEGTEIPYTYEEEKEGVHKPIGFCVA